MAFNPDDESDCENSFINVTDSNGKPIIYYGNDENIVIDNVDARQIIFCNVNNSLITSTSLTANKVDAIALWVGYGNNIINVTSYSSEWYAIEIVAANRTRVTDNTLSVGWAGCKYGADCLSVIAAATGQNNVFLHNTLYGDHWVDANEPDIALNDSTNGNIHYFYNGTPVSSLCSLTSSTYDWADGGELPLSNNSNCLMGWGVNHWGNECAQDWHPWVGSTPRTPQSSSGSPKKWLVLDRLFNCSSGKFIISATYSNAGVSDLTVKLFKTRNYEYIEKQTISHGNLLPLATDDF